VRKRIAESDCRRGSATWTVRSHVDADVEADVESNVEANVESNVKAIVECRVEQLRNKSDSRRNVHPQKAW
jgi:hypothetical protein